MQERSPKQSKRFFFKYWTEYHSVHGKVKFHKWTHEWLPNLIHHSGQLIGYAGLLEGPSLELGQGSSIIFVTLRLPRKLNHKGFYSIPEKNG